MRLSDLIKLKKWIIEYCYDHGTISWSDYYEFFGIFYDVSVRNRDVRELELGRYDNIPQEHLETKNAQGKETMRGREFRRGLLGYDGSPEQEGQNDEGRSFQKTDNVGVQPAPLEE